MTQIRFLQQADLSHLITPVRYRRQILKQPELEMGFIATFENGESPYCMIVLRDGKRRYKIEAWTRTISIEGSNDRLVVPEAPIDIKEYYRSFAFTKRQEGLIMQLLNYSYIQKKIDADSYLGYVKELTTTKKDIMEKIGKNYNRRNGLNGAWIGLALGSILYQAREWTSVPVFHYLDLPYIAGISTFLGGFIDSSMPEFAILKEARQKRKAMAREMSEMKTNLESRVKIV